MPRETAVEILLVEDNPSDAELTLRALARNEISDTIHLVRDGEEALDFLFCRGSYAARSFDAPPRLVLLDVKLPKVNGLEVLEKLKSDRRTRAIPVVMLTSSREERDVAQGYQSGANSYIQKPLDFMEFRTTAKQLGIYWLSINVAPPVRAFCSE
jgi:two-component system, response regulator